MQAPDLIQQLYLRVDQWTGNKTMDHASGIWGREPTLQYLRSLIRPGNLVVDLGCGAGFPTLQLMPMVGPRGSVIGFDISQEMIGATREYHMVPNLRFRRSDITRRLPIDDATADVVTSFMVLHNLSLCDLQRVFIQAHRILMPGGKAVFLTMHHQALDSERWDMDFMVYDKTALDLYDRVPVNAREGMVVGGVVKNASGGTKDVCMIHHSESAVMMMAEAAELAMIHSEDLWIDGATAEQKFGSGSSRKLPTTPTFWMFVLEKKR